MATYSVDAVEVFGRGVLKSEGVVVDKENNVYGGGRNGVMYKVSPDGKVNELCTLPEGSIPNGVTRWCRSIGRKVIGISRRRASS